MKHAKDATDVKGRAGAMAGWDPYTMVQEWLAAGVYPVGTGEKYRRDSGEWLACCRDNGLNWDKVAAQHIALWAHRPAGPRRATARRISAVRSFYEYAVGQGAIPYNPGARRPRLTDPARLTMAALDPRQIAVLFAALDEWGPADSRHPQQDRACGYLLIGLGLPSSQLLGITLDDLTTDRGKDALRLTGPPTGERLAPLPHLVRRAVDAYLPYRVPARDGTRGGLLFTSRTGAKMPHRYPRDLLRAVATASGLLRTAGT